MPTEPRARVVHLVHSLSGGGTERTLVRLLQAFDHTRMQHSVVTLRDCGMLAERLPDEVACRPLNAASRDRTIGLRLARVVRGLRADILHARGTGCWLDATVAGLLAPNARVVLGFHGSELTPALEKRQRRRARWGLRAGARFTSVSWAGRQRLMIEAGIPQERINVLPNGVDLKHFTCKTNSERAQARRACRLPLDATVVGIVGSLIPVKGHAALLRALAALNARGRHLHLLIVGDGPARAAVNRQVRAAGLEQQVTITGWSEEVAALLPALDLYVCCSIAEGMNNAMLEAMATGLPIIATDVGDNATVVRHGHEGLIVAPGSDVALTEAIGRLADSPGLRRRLASASLRRVNAFDFRHSVGAYESYYEFLLGRVLVPRRQMPVDKAMAASADLWRSPGTSPGDAADPEPWVAESPSVR